jgi:hypothetical protein
MLYPYEHHSRGLGELVNDADWLLHSCGPASPRAHGRFSFSLLWVVLTSVLGLLNFRKGEFYVF